MGKDETSEVKAHSVLWRHSIEVNPVCCKEICIKGARSQIDNRLISWATMQLDR